MPDIFKATKTNHAAHTAKKQPARIFSPHVGLFTTVSQHPDCLSFENKKQDEEIVLFLRAAFITNFGWIFLTFLLAFAPLILPFSLQLINFTIPVSFQLSILLIIAYYLFVLQFAFTNFITWFYNVGIITSKQVIDIDFSHVTYRNVAISTLDDIVDVEYNQGGFLLSIFDYGDIFIQTEGRKPNFEFYNVPQPQKVVNIIMNLLDTRGTNK